jgi:hypothetical protein
VVVNVRNEAGAEVAADAQDSGRGRAEVLYWGFSVSFPLEITVAVYCGIVLLAVMYSTIVSYAVYVTFVGRTGVFASWHLFPGFFFSITLVRQAFCRNFVKPYLPASFFSVLMHNFVKPSTFILHWGHRQAWWCVASIAHCH